MSEIQYTLTRGDETFDLSIEFTHTPFVPARTYGPPEDCDPAEGGEIEEFQAYLADEPFILTPEEETAAVEYIYSHYDFEPEDYYD